MQTKHPICTTLHDLREALGLSLLYVANKVGMSPFTLGSYERGDRNPPLAKIENVLNVYGYTLGAIPLNSRAPRLREDMVTDLRSMADQLEGLEPPVRVTAQNAPNRMPPRL